MTRPAVRVDRPRPFSHLPPAQTVAAGALVVLLVVLALKTMAVLLQPLFVAIFFFYLGKPLSRALSSRGVPAALANLAILPVAVIVLALVGWVVWAHVDDFLRRLPVYNRELREAAAPWIEWLKNNAPAGGEGIPELADGLFGMTNILRNLVAKTLGGFVGWVRMVLLVVVYLVFLNFEAVTLPRRLEAAFGHEQASSLLAIGERTNSAIVRYVYVKTLASLLVGSLSTLALVAFRVDMAILWGALVFFGNFIPYLGSAVAVVLPITIAALQFEGVAPVIILSLLLVAFQVLVGQILEPRFAGIQLNLSPLLVILSLAFWGWLWGVIGLLISIPVMVSARLVLANVELTRPLAVLMTEQPTVMDDDG